MAGLIRSCHPIPTVGVTAFTTALAAAAGNHVGTCVLLAAAVLTGQLTIGWSNDRLDWRADQLVGRRDKPLAIGAVSLRVVDAAIGVASIACIGLSLALGWRAGALHLFAVACGWAYNVKLKGTWLSWLPYAVAFGALPGVATLALPAHPLPAAWVVGGAAMLGVAANLTNALPDLERDAATGFHGLPSRLGARTSVVVAQILLIAASACVTFGPPGPPHNAAWVGLGLTVALVLATAPSLWREAPTRTPFYGLMALVPIDLVVIVLNGHRLR